MLRVRFHGRGGQGVKTASRILGTALFHEGLQVQDAPRYGAERRGAPIFAYVRASRDPIHERGIIDHPDLVVAVDDTLMGMAAAGVTVGTTEASSLLICSETPAETWAHRLRLRGPVYTLSPTDERRTGVACVGAAARLLGVKSWSSLSRAVVEELDGRSGEVVEENLTAAQVGWQALGPHAGAVTATAHEAPVALAQWIELIPEEGVRASPTIHATSTSLDNPTGLWRTVEPIIDEHHCHGCSWICGSFCPDNAIVVHGHKPEVDLHHCKGCMICAAQCPHHAIALVPAGTTERRRAEGGAS